MESPVLMFLDAGLNYSAIDVPYDNILWVSRYYDFGEFQIQIPARYFNTAWKYVQCSGHQELGLVLKYQYNSKNGKVIISGYFAEWALDRSIAWPRFKKSGEVGSLCRQLVSTYYMKNSNSVFNDYTSSYNLLPITPNIDYDVPTGRNYEADFVGENLGTKMFSMLRKDELSYKVVFNREEKMCYFMIWKGADTRGNEYSVNDDALVLSEALGSLTDIDMTIDSSAYKNVVMLVYNYDRENNTFEHAGPSTRGDFAPGKSKATYWEYDSNTNETQDEHMAPYNDVVTINAKITDQNVASNSLGKLVSLKIESVGLAIDTRVAEVTTTYKNGTREIEVGFGDKRVTNLQRAIGVLR